MAETQQEERPGGAGRVGAVRKKRGGATETTGIGLERYSNKIEKKNTEML